MEAADLIKTLLEGFKAVAKTETIIGEGIKAGECTVLPVSKISFGRRRRRWKQNKSRPRGKRRRRRRRDLRRADRLSGGQGR